MLPVSSAPARCGLAQTRSSVACCLVKILRNAVGGSRLNVDVGAVASNSRPDVPPSSRRPAQTQPPTHERFPSFVERRTATLPGRPVYSIPPTRARSHRLRDPHFLSKLSSCTVSYTGLWDGTANHEGYDRQRCDTNTLPTSTRSSPQTLSTAVASVWLWNHLHLLTLLWEPTCTAGTGLDDAKRLQGGCLPSRRGRAVRCHHRRHRGHAALRRRCAAGASVAGAEEEVL